MVFQFHGQEDNHGPTPAKEERCSSLEATVPRLVNFDLTSLTSFNQYQSSLLLLAAIAVEDALCRLFMLLMERPDARLAETDIV